MKKIKGLILVTLLCTFGLFLLGIKNVEAASLTGMIKSDGSKLTYNGSGEQVQMLSEYQYATNEFRAAWVSHFAGDISSYSNETQYKQMMTTVLNNMQSWGMNAIIYHVRTHNNAMYKSELNPRARWWANVDFNTFDPLEWLINETHSRGMEFHAWMNPYRILTNGTTFMNSTGSIPAINPVNDSSNLIQVGDNIIFNPGKEVVRNFLVDTCMELVENYDVDAIHFDDYFYIDGYESDETDDEKRENVNMFIEALHNSLYEYNITNKKAVQLGISPSGIYQNGGGSYPTNPTYDANGNLTNPVYSATSGFAHYGNYLYSDTLHWINEEWIDYILPQMYWAIEHTGASYVDTGRWWSWAVRNKDVNFYSGNGIYMALGSGVSSSYWQRNDDEIEKQLLFIDQFDEYQGTSFYKYASLLNTSNTLVQNGKAFITEHWGAKKIPSAIIKGYTELFDEVTPTNVTYNSSNSTISFDAVDNVRGYMVYQVPKGESLNKNNIKHIYEYTTSTTIEIVDVDKYDYYVASVNLANETSDAAQVLFNVTYQRVIDAINALPSTITLEHQQQIASTRALYNALSEQDKTLVTNLNTLVLAEKALENYKNMQQEFENYLKTLDLHIKTNRVITLKEGMTLSYKNESDKNIYDIKTGTRLKNHLATKLIPLIVTYEVGTYKLTAEINVNVGLTATNQIGLFYRNDPSAIGEEDDGQYTKDDSKFIGWSGHTFVVEEKVLYIAYGNYFEITDGTIEIPPHNWSSVAIVYVNKTEGDLLIPLSKPFDSYSSNDGYIIINENKVKATGINLSTSDSITLEKDETLVITRYLDSQLNGSPMYPTTKIQIGTKAYIDVENVRTPQEIATEIDNLIATIPTNITLNDEVLINDIYNQYNSLSNEVKDLVTKHNILTEALSKIEAIKNEMVTEVINKINTIPTIVTLENENLVNSILESYNALSIDLQVKVTNKDTLMKALSTITTLKEELNKVKEEAKGTLITLKNPDNFSNAGKQEINEAIDSAILIIDTLTNESDILNEISKIEEKIENLKKTDDTYVRYTWTNKIDLLLESYNDVTEGERAELEKIAENFKKQISTGRLTELDYVYSRAVASMKEYFENLDMAKQNAISDINNFVASLTYTQNELDIIKNLANQKIISVQEMASVSQINSVANLFKTEVENIHDELEEYKLLIKDSFDELVHTWYTEKQKEQVRIIIEEAKLAIDLAGNKENVDDVKKECELATQNYIVEIKEKIDTAKAYLNSKKIDDNKEISDLINKTLYLVVAAGTNSEIDEMILEFDSQYEIILTKSNLEQYKVLLKEDINTYISKLDYSENELTYINNQKQEVFNQINSALNTEMVDKLVSDFKQFIVKYHEELTSAKEDATYKVNIKEAVTDNAKQLKEETLLKINVAKTVDEINTIMNNFTEQFEKLNVVEEGCNCSSAAVILIILSFATALGLMFRKRS